MSKTIQFQYNTKYRNHCDKLESIPVKTLKADNAKILPKPKWIKIKLPIHLHQAQKIKYIVRKHGLNTVCEEASCPNILECFSNGTATFMILGDICTRRCMFCNISHGRPKDPDFNEPMKIAKAIKDMGLKYVVITSVDRDDLRDGGAKHFANSILAIRQQNPSIKIEILVPDFRGCMDRALKTLTTAIPDIFSHNLENVPRIYNKICPGANYEWSLKLLSKFKQLHPTVPTKSGLMVGLGETNQEIIDVMHDLRKHGVTMLTLGQYLQPTKHHLSVKRYVTPQEFKEIENEAKAMGFTYASCGPLIRSSYHANLQVKGTDIK